MVQLKPEIYRLIVKALISSYDQPSDSSPASGKRLNEVPLPGKGHQAALANLMRVSKVSTASLSQTNNQVFYEICKTELYRDCLIGDIDTFVQDLPTNPRKPDLLSRIRSLRIYQADHQLLKEPTYLQLVTTEGDEWYYLGIKLAPVDPIAGLEFAAMNSAFGDRYFSKPACDLLRSAIDAGPACDAPLGRLDRVIMTGESDTFPWGWESMRIEIYRQRLHASPVPLFLLDLPIVRHYCQCSPNGPLALPPQMK